MRTCGGRGVRVAEAGVGHERIDTVAVVVAGTASATAIPLEAWGIAALAPNVGMFPGLLALGIAAVVVGVSVAAMVIPGPIADRVRSRVDELWYYLAFVAVLMVVLTIVVASLAVADRVRLRIFDTAGATVWILLAGTAASIAVCAATIGREPMPTWSQRGVAAMLVSAAVVIVGAEAFGMHWESEVVRPVASVDENGGLAAVAYRKGWGDAPVLTLRDVIVVAEPQRLSAFSGATGELVWWATYPVGDRGSGEAELRSADPLRADLVLTMHDVDFTIDGDTGELVAATRHAAPAEAGLGQTTPRAVVGADGDLFVAGDMSALGWSRVRLTDRRRRLVDSFDLPSAADRLGDGPLFAHRLPDDRIVVAADGARTLMVRDLDAQTVSTIEPDYRPMPVSEDHVAVIGNRIVVSDDAVLTVIDAPTARVERRVESVCTGGAAMSRVATVAHRVVVECPGTGEWVGLG